MLVGNQRHPLDIDLVLLPCKVDISIREPVFLELTVSCSLDELVLAMPNPGFDLLKCVTNPFIFQNPVQVPPFRFSQLRFWSLDGASVAWVGCFTSHFVPHQDLQCLYCL